MIKKIKHIVVGWAKHLGLLPVDKVEQKLSQLRTSICQACPFAKESRVLKIVNGNGVYEQILKCSKCGCPLVAKTIVVDEKCPVGKW